MTRFAPALYLSRLADEWFGFLAPGQIEPIRSELALSYAAAGLLLALPGIAGLVELPISIAIDFGSRRALAASGALAYGACLFAFALGASLAVLGPAAFLLGLASGALCGAAEVSLVERYPDAAEEALGRSNAAATVGDLLGPLTIAAAVAAGVGWRWLFVAGAAAMALYAWWLARQDFPRPERPAHAATPLAAVRAVLRDRRVWALAAIDGLFSSLDEPFLGFTSAHLIQTRRMGPAMAGAVITTLVAAGVAGALAVGRLRRRNGRRALLAASILAVLAGVLALALVPYTPALFVAAALFGAGTAVFWAVFSAAYLTLNPGLAGTTGAVMTVVTIFADAIPPLVGWVSDRAGLTAGVSIYAGVAAAILVLVLTARGTREHACR